MKTETQTSPARKLKILVFDDTELHRISAKLSLAGHDLTIVGTYDEAQKALVPKTDFEKSRGLLSGLLEKAGLKPDFNPHRETSKAADKWKYFALQKESYRLATPYPNFDVLLTDLFVPASQQAMGGKGMSLVGKEMPLGTTIALLALSVGIRDVAVVTDESHHAHPASAAFDCFGENRSPYINIMCTNNVSYVEIDEVTGEMVSEEFLLSPAGIEKYPHPRGQTWGHQGIVQGGKDWGQVLKMLLAETKTPGLL